MMGIIDEIKNLERKISELPKGTLVYKNINGKKQPYLQQTIKGKSISTYIKQKDREKVLQQIELRNELNEQLKELKYKIGYKQDISNYSNIDDKLSFKTSVLIGDNLREFVEIAKNYKKRKCYDDIKEYLHNDVFNKVFILYGLRRTGKTTLIKQAILNMGNSDFNKTAFVQILASNTLAELNQDLIVLREKGYKYVFIDEVTLMNDFIEGAALLSDIFVAGGIKIILSGTDSLGFWISEDEQLFDRCVMVHTTFISYSEFENVLGIKGIDNYICYGGTMSLDGKHYNKYNMFRNEQSVDEYVDSAIAKNIQHSLKCYQYEGHFRHLEELYQSRELTSAINRVVEDTNHKFTIDVLTHNFESHDLGVSANNLRRDVKNPNRILDEIDIKEFTDRLKTALEILNKNEQKIEIKEIHKLEIEEYLYALDLIQYIDIETIQNIEVKSKLTVITQPGLRYSQAKILIEKLLLDKVFNTISATHKKEICDRILNEIKGRMMEEIVLLETTIAKKEEKVFKLQFSRGEFDMVVVDTEKVTCDIYEIKHSDKIVDMQYKNLIDEQKCKDTEFRYGKILNKYVIYRGEDKVLDNGIKYINVESYLKNLY